MDNARIVAILLDLLMSMCHYPNNCKELNLEPCSSSTNLNGRVVTEEDKVNPDVPFAKYTALAFHPDLLNYCLRFYDRQFITREEINHSVVKKFITLLDNYINTRAQSEGLPSVAWFADKCCLSTGCFGTLVKTETGRAAKDIIADRLLAHAKQLLNDDKLTITIISSRLGFDYPQHFVRFFKTHTGKTPSAYRKAS